MERTFFGSDSVNSLDKQLPNTGFGSLNSKKKLFLFSAQNGVAKSNLQFLVSFFLIGACCTNYDNSEAVLLAQYTSGVKNRSNQPKKKLRLRKQNDRRPTKCQTFRSCMRNTIWTNSVIVELVELPKQFWSVLYVPLLRFGGGKGVVPERAKKENKWQRKVWRKC